MPKISRSKLNEIINRSINEAHVSPSIASELREVGKKTIKVTSGVFVWDGIGCPLFQCGYDPGEPEQYRSWPAELSTFADVFDTLVEQTLSTKASVLVLDIEN